MAINCRLSTILGEKRLKMSDVVRETGLSKGTVHALYHDRVTKVDYKVLDKLCSFLGCELGDIIIYTKNE